MNLRRAEAIAANLQKTLAPCCERIAVAGSVRRQRYIVKDIELVAIPRHVPDLLGGPGQSLLDAQLEELQARRVLILDKNGPHYKKLQLLDGQVDVDLFLCTPENWGWILFLRTGPTDYVHAAVTPRDVVGSSGRPGMLPPGYHSSGGYLYHFDRKLDVPDEEAVFRILNIDPITPARRK